jgi:WD40 repeat protein/tRNA A-37 threonylcarbamoyl transferase component Bud32
MPDRTETLAPRAGCASTMPADPSEAVRRDPVDEDVAPDDPERYEQIAEHARGGLGRVVRAVDRRLGRTVAVKELLRHDASNEARFLREAMITARLEHPGIVPVHEAGRWPNGDPYYVMKLVEGRTLKELIVEATTLRTRLGLLPHVIAVADAVGYAHSQGVIHRDIKPSNVIVGEFGETIVVDWGLARDRKRDLPEPAEDLLTAAGSGASTVSGRVVGTPAYMSPEQARGAVVDERADVYALGAVLYELLAGSPPHSDTTPQAVLDRVIAGPPRPLPMVVPSVPVELATVVRKAMARDPDARYPNAVALAEDLRRFATGQLVRAHSYSTWALLRKKLARYRGMVAVAVASMIVLAAIGVASVRRVIAERNIARSERSVAELALTSAEKRKRELVLLQAETALAKDPTAALAWLKSYDVATDDRGGVVDMVDEALALGVARHVFRPGDWVLDSRFTPDGTSLVAAARDGMIRRYDLASGAEFELGHAPSPPYALALTADGELAITGGAQGEVIAWPLRGGPPRLLVDTDNRMVSQLRLSPDGKTLLIDRNASPPQVVALAGGEPTALAPTTGIRYAVAAEDWSRVVMMTAANEIAVPSERDGDPARVLAHIEKAIAFFAVSPHGDTVLVHDGTTLWSLPFTGGPLHELARYGDKLGTVAWSSDGRTLAIGGHRPEIVVVDLATGKTSELRGHSDAIYTVEFTRDGTRLLSASDDATARLWTLSTQAAIVLRGHDDDVFRAHLSADERSVATSSLDGSARVWAIDSPSARVYTERDRIEGMRFDGADLVVRTATSVARWNLASGAREAVSSWADEAHTLGYGIASYDGQHVVIPRADGSLELRVRGQAPVVLRGHRGLVTHVEFSRDGRAVYSSSVDGTLRRWDADTGAGAVVLEASAPIRGFAVARDGRVAAQSGDLAYLIDPAGRITRLGKGGVWCVDFAEFEPVTDRLIIHRCDNHLAIVEGGRQIELSTDGYGVSRVAVSPDGRWIAGGLVDRTIRLWSTETGALLDVLHGHTDLPLDVAFSPDGKLLASASWDKTIRLWNLETKHHRVLRGHTAEVTRVVWRDGGHLVSGSADGTIRLWDVPSLELPSALDIARRLDAATTARIARDRPATGMPASRGT